MIVTCKNIMKLPAMKNTKLIAGDGGLNRIIRWVHVMENPEFSQWLKGGELLLLTGVLIKDDNNELIKLLKDINSRNLSGMVINVGPYIKEIPRELIELADELNFPIFELPFEFGFIDISQSICKAIFMRKIEQETVDNFIKDIIFGDICITEAILNRASYYGYDQDKNYYAVIVNINNYEQYIKSKNVWDEEKILEFKQHVEQIIVDEMIKWNKRILHVLQNDAVIIMIPIDEGEINKINTIAEDILKNVQKKIKDIDVSIGIGGYSKELKDFKKAVGRAQKALKVINLLSTQKKIIDYSNIGVYRLFFEMNNYEEITSIYYEYLKKLIDYDLKYDANLLNTLEAYIEEGGNLVKASERLFIHRNTLKYRIQRIKEILDCDLKEINNMFNLNLALKIGKFLKLHC